MYQLQFVEVYLLSIHIKTTVKVSASVGKGKHPGAELLIRSPSEKNQSNALCVLTCCMNCQSTCVTWGWGKAWFLGVLEKL